MRSFFFEPKEGKISREKKAGKKKKHVQPKLQPKVSVHIFRQAPPIKANHVVHLPSTFITSSKVVLLLYYSTYYSTTLRITAHNYRSVPCVLLANGYNAPTTNNSSRDSVCTEHHTLITAELRLLTSPKRLLSVCV